MDQPEKPAAEPTAAEIAQQNVAAIRQQFLNGVSWFYWIGALSLINLALGHFLHRKFIFGLGIPALLDTRAFEQGKINPGWIAASVAVSLGFMGLGFLGRKGKRLFIILGLAIYALDLALLVLAKDWLSVLFHGFAGWSIIKGYQALGTILAGVPDSTVKAAAE